MSMRVLTCLWLVVALQITNTIWYLGTAHPRPFAIGLDTGGLVFSSALAIVWSIIGVADELRDRQR